MQRRLGMPDGQEQHSPVEGEKPRAKKHKKSAIWTIANAPITLWLLSTVAVGVISATVTEQSTCNRDFERDALEFKKLSDEIPGRNRLLYKRLPDASSEDEYNQIIEKFIDGELFYVYSDYKGKTIKELSLMRTMLAKKLTPKWSGHPLAVCKVELQYTETDMRPESGHCDELVGEPKIQVEEGPREGTYSENNSASPYEPKVGLRGFGKEASAQYFKALKEDAFKASIAYDAARDNVEKGDYWDIPKRCTLGHIWKGLLGID
jgi:hypothetical protein